MNWATNLILLSSFFISCYCQDRIASDLRSVIVVFRHGERNIIKTYPNDPYANVSYWPGGFGQLTNKGKMHHYLLGQWFRRRYSGFITEQYDPDDIRVESTDVDRTLMSAGAHLAGLYPPPQHQKWDPSIDWQPIPIHSKISSEDPKLASRRNCPRYEELYNANWENMQRSNPALKQLLDNVTDFINNHTEAGFVAGIDDLLKMYDVFKVEEENGLQLPQWAHQVYPDQLTKIAKVRFTLEARTDDLARLKMGLLMREFVDHFHNISEPKNETYPKYRIYSAHDFTIADIQYPLGLFDGTLPSYAGALIFELRRSNVTQEHYVNVLYKNSVDAEPAQLTIRGCDFDCGLQRFDAILQPVTMKNLTEWVEACEKTVYPEYMRRNTRTRTMLELM